MLLAALVLLLPLIVISALVVRDKNAQIAAVDDARHGIEYLLQGRLLLDVMGAAFVAAASDQAIADRTSVQHAVEDRLDSMLRHLADEGDAFGLQPRIGEIEAEWRGYLAAESALDRQARLLRQTGLNSRLLALLRYIGDRSGLSAQPTLESAYLGKLVVHQVPEAIVRIGEIRAQIDRASEHGVSLSQTSSFLFNDWSLSLAHTELVRDFRTVSALDPRLEHHLSSMLAEFDATAHRFHIAVTGHGAGDHMAHSRNDHHGGTRRVDGPIGGAAGRYPADIDTLPPATLMRLGDEATATAMALFDRAASGLQNLLDGRRQTLGRTKVLALAIVIGTGLFAFVAGWFLLHALTRPLQAEIAERKRAEQKAHELAAIVESSQDSILVIGPDNTFTNWNRGAEKLYG
jgi:PAS domain-containing protein